MSCRRSNDACALVKLRVTVSPGCSLPTGLRGWLVRGIDYAGSRARPYYVRTRCVNQAHPLALSEAPLRFCIGLYPPSDGPSIWNSLPPRAAAHLYLSVLFESAIYICPACIRNLHLSCSHQLSRLTHAAWLRPRSQQCPEHVGAEVVGAQLEVVCRPGGLSKRGIAPLLTTICHVWAFACPRNVTGSLPLAGRVRRCMGLVS